MSSFMTGVISRIKEKVAGSELFKSVMTLSLGSLFSQLIPILATFVLARIYTEDNYADWGIFLSYASIIVVFICGRYEYSILLPKRSVDALNLTVLSILIAVCVTVAIFLFIIISDLSGWNLISKIPGRYWLPVFTLFTAIMQIYGNYANRHEEYKVLASSSVVKSLTQSLSRIGLGWIFRSSGLIVGAVVGSLGGSIYFAYKFKLMRFLKRSFSWKRMFQLASVYHKFPVYELPGSILNALSTNLPIILMPIFFDGNDIGLFSMTIGLLYIPMSLIGTSIGQVFYKKAAVGKDDRVIAQLASKFFRFTFILGAMVALVLLLGGNTMFTFLLGYKWSNVGTYSIILCIWIWLVLCFSPLSRIFDVKGKQNIEMWINLVLLVLRISAIIVGGMFFKSMIHTVILYGMVGMIMWFVEGIIICKLTGINVLKNIGGLILALFVLFIWIVKIWWILF